MISCHLLLGKWTVPNRSGSVFPPSAGFSIDVVPGSNTAIIYGGRCVKDQKRTCTNDTFIMSYTKNTVVSNVLLLLVHVCIQSSCYTTIYMFCIARKCSGKILS